MKICAVLASLLAGAASFVIANAAHAQDDEPVEYVRVCDVYGAGFFYIPGTDTCLQIGGRLTYSQIDNRSNLGGGTVTRGGSDHFLFRLPSRIDRYGFGWSVETSVDWLDGNDGAGEPSPAVSFFLAEFDAAWGSADGSGRAEIGVDDTTGVGISFNALNSMFGTGYGTSSAGFGLEGSGSIDNFWVLGSTGFGRTYLLGDADTSRSALVLRGSLYAEGLEYDASGSTVVLFGGAPFGDYRQDFEYESSDLYVGVKLGAEYLLQATPQLQFSFGGSLLPGYHKGKGEYRLETNATGNPAVIETHSYDESGLTIGAELSVGMDWRVLPNLSIGTGVKVSWQQDATAFDATESPDTLGDGFHDEDIYRVFVDLLKVQGTF